ncbi:MAG TPA: hypothetical protein VMW73_17280 [Spirochaetia bacterium]|nr:hypothetical protein [Spirochaetia bacterium]
MNHRDTVGMPRVASDRKSCLTHEIRSSFDEGMDSDNRLVVQWAIIGRPTPSTFNQFATDPAEDHLQGRQSIAGTPPVPVIPNATVFASGVPAGPPPTTSTSTCSELTRSFAGSDRSSLS